jgi:hypothetical protein
VFFEKLKKATEAEASRAEASIKEPANLLENLDIYEYHDLTLTLEISIYQRRNDPFYPLSSLPKFTVNLKGTRSFNCFELNGNVVEEPEKMISVTLSKQHD